MGAGKKDMPWQARNELAFYSRGDALNIHLLQYEGSVAVKRSGVDFRLSRPFFNMKQGGFHVG